MDRQEMTLQRAERFFYFQSYKVRNLVQAVLKVLRRMQVCDAEIAKAQQSRLALVQPFFAGIGIGTTMSKDGQLHVYSGNEAHRTDRARATCTEAHRRRNSAIVARVQPAPSDHLLCADCAYHIPSGAPVSRKLLHGSKRSIRTSQIWFEIGVQKMHLSLGPGACGWH